MRTILQALVLAAALALAAPLAHAGNQLPVAVGGYDVVSYHTEESPVRGHARFNHFWNGAVWFFSSQENRAAFAENPEAYAPAFDGYCAFAAALNYAAPGDPLVYTVHDGALYLNVSERAQELWSEDIPGNIEKAQQNWPRIHPF